MGYLREIVEYGRTTERDREKLVKSYRQTEAAYIVVGTLVMAALLCGLIWLGHRDSQGWESSKAKRARTAVCSTIEQEAWIK